MKRIIVADDDPGVQDVIMLLLTKFGYEADVHKNADRLLGNNFEEPALFILDKQLHNVNGLDVCRALKSRKDVQTPVVIFSAGNNLNNLAEDAGADAFLDKPFTIAKLREVIEKFT